MNFDQGEFNFDPSADEAGWRRWREELDQHRRAFELRWGVILGRPVRVELRNLEKPVRGMIRYQQERGKPPRFHIRGLEFSAEEIVNIVQIAEEE